MGTTSHRVEIIVVPRAEVADVIPGWHQIVLVSERVLAVGKAYVDGDYGDVWGDIVTGIVRYLNAGKIEGGKFGKREVDNSLRYLWSEGQIDAPEIEAKTAHDGHRIKVNA